MEVKEAREVAMGGKERPFSIVVCILVTFFGVSTFLHVDTISAELPVLVQKLPEYWELPAYFTFIICVICSFPPLGYFIIHSFLPGSGGGGDHAVKMICTVFCVGIVSSILLIIFWNYTSMVGGQLHSTAFLTLVFITGSINYVSLLMFVSYMVRLPVVYIPAFHVGEGMAGLMSSIVGLIQGAGNYECKPRTLNTSHDNNNNFTMLDYSHGNISYDLARMKSSTNDTIRNTTEVVYHEPLFSVEVFFVYLLVMLLICTGSFFMLHFSPYCRKFHIGLSANPILGEISVESEACIDGNRQTHVPRLTPQDANEMETRVTNLSNESDRLDPTLDSAYENTTEEDENSQPSRPQIIDTKTYYWLLFLTFWIGGVKYGAMDGMQSYSALPYGSVTFSLVNRLGLAAIPASSIVAYVLPTRSITVININAVINLFAALYVVVLSTWSPHPPLWDTNPTLGGALVVIAWITVSVTLGYTRALMSSLIRERGERALVWFGMTYLFGTLVGNLPVFLCVSVFQLFEEALPCQI